MTIDLKSPMLLGFYQGNTHSERFGKDIPASYCVSNQDIPNDARAQDLQTFNRFCHQLSHGMPDLAISSANNEIKSVQINQNRRNFSTNRKEDDSEIENDLFRYKTRIRFRDRPVQCKITPPFIPALNTHTLFLATPPSLYAEKASTLVSEAQSVGRCRLPSSSRSRCSTPSAACRCRTRPA